MTSMFAPPQSGLTAAQKEAAQQRKFERAQAQRDHQEELDRAQAERAARAGGQRGFTSLLSGGFGGFRLGSAPNSTV